MSELAAANRQYFDSITDRYESLPFFQQLNDQITGYFRGNLSWLGIPMCNTKDAPPAKEVRLLDYACGTGLVTRSFSPYVTKTVGMDLSPNMAKAYNDKAAQGNISEDVVHAVVGDLLDKSNPNPSEFTGAEWHNFDLLTVGLAFHHFEDTRFAASQLRKRLRPGGVMVLSDFVEGGDMLVGDDGKPVPGSEGNHAFHGHGHHHHGHGHGEQKKEHEHDQHSNPTHQHGHEPSEASKEKIAAMSASIVVPHFTVDFVKKFLTDAGFEDVDVQTLKEKSFMEFGGKKLFRTLLFARGRNPNRHSEL